MTPNVKSWKRASKRSNSCIRTFPVPKSWLEKAKENIIAMLDIKGISISEIEMDMLIEACVAEFNLAFLQKAKEERMEEMHNGSNVSETR